MASTGRPQGFGSDPPTGSGRARGSPQSLSFGNVGNDRVSRSLV